MDYRVEASHKEYNVFIQKIQSEAASWRMETRIELFGGRARFEVYWDGEWHTLAEETPFSNERRGWVSEDAWSRLQAEAARSLANS